MTRTLVIGAALVWALVLAAPAAADHVQCGDVISQDTTLDADLVCAGDGVILEGDVILDLAGHAIAGSGPGIGVGAYSPTQAVAVRGGAIRGFQLGILLDGPRGTSLRRLVLEHNAVGVRCQYAPECRIEGSVARRNDVGISIQAADGGDPEPTVIRRNVVRENETGVSFTGEAGLIADNRIERNTRAGISNDYGRPVLITRNLVRWNGGEGVNVFFGASATVADNRIVRNAANGVGVHGGFGANTTATLEGNRITMNGGDGVLVENADTHVVVQHNRTDRNGDDGIDVDFAIPCCDETVVRANWALFNTDLGIEAAPQTTDGGGNKAKHNGNPAQCVGVRCR